MKKFKPTIKWLKQAICELGYEDLANKLKYNDCWPELGMYVKNWPPALLEALTKKLAESGSGPACYLYLYYIKDRKDVRQALIESGDGWYCYSYLRNIADRDQVRQAMIDSGNGGACYWYLRDVSDRADVRQAMINSCDHEACRWYCLHIKDRPEVRAAIDKAGGRKKRKI